MNYQKEAPESVMELFLKNGIEYGTIDYYAFPETFGTTAGPRIGAIAGQSISSFTVEAWVHSLATVYVCNGVMKIQTGEYKAKWPR